ncbi:DeoR/GlpR family DNA-binding transcription regulator [uncultured Amnibacterium sp.]|uniref:DeoR/GlpR family DNA-binding transcription regulator n=1 Tax=uncultured Amnibacterium sp. TaxID=1631851 RepID=UPI0035CC16C2
MTVIGTLDAEARRTAMLRLLEERGALHLHESAESWHVHPMTVRRDFDELVASGAARRVRGGIVTLGGDAFAQRRYRHADAKRRIAEKLRDLVAPGSLIAMDSSTTVHRLADSIAGIDDVAVLTNGLAAFQSLHGREGVTAYLTGGERDEENLSLVGPLAVLSVRQFTFDTCFLSARNVDSEFGTSETTLHQVAVKQAMVDTARRCVLAVDSSKLETRARIRSVPLPRFDVLVTELEPEDPRLDPYRHLVPSLL